MNIVVKRTCSEPTSFEHASDVYELRRFPGFFFTGISV